MYISHSLSVQQAVKIALEVKKALVDGDRLDLRQEALEEVLFASMRARGFGDEYIQRYRMMNRFQQAKRPLIVMVCGSAAVGKSGLAQALASRLNLPNVLQTDVLRDLMQGGEGAPLLEEPLWMRPGLDDPAALAEAYREESAVVRRALDGDLVKCIADGKSIIIEGLHLDPGLYLDEYGPGGALERRAEAAAVAAEAAAAIESVELSRADSEEGARQNGGGVLAVQCRSRSIDEGLLTYGQPVFVPILLRLDPEDYEFVAEEWLRTQVPPGGGPAALRRLLALQEYLARYAARGVPVMTTGALTSQETLDAMHDHVLASIADALGMGPL